MVEAAALRGLFYNPLWLRCFFFILRSSSEQPTLSRVTFPLVACQCHLPSCLFSVALSDP